MSEAAHAATLDMIGQLARLHDIRGSTRCFPVERWSAQQEGLLFHVNLHHRGRKMVTHFRRGRLDGRTPTVAETLFKLAEEARLINAAASVDELARIRGHMPTSWRDMADEGKLFAHLCRQRDELRRFLGDTLYWAIVGVREVSTS